MSSDNKLDKTGLAYLWSKMTAYVQEIVGYVPELFIQIGNTPLGTTAATISGAIREIGDRVGNTVMGTTAATVTGAVKELVDKIGNAEMGTEAVTITGAIAEHEQDINDLSSKFNIVHVAPTAFNVSNNTETVLATANVAEGKWLIMAGASWNSNSTGTRYIYTGDPRNCKDLRQAVSGDATYTRLEYVTQFNNSTTITLTGKQNSGSSIQVYPYITALRLP